MLKLIDVNLQTAEKHLVKDLTLSVPPGHFVTVSGHSGVGKSTLLSWVIGITPPHVQASGTLMLNGNDLTDTPSRKRRIGILFQDDLLFPHMTVEENLLFAVPRQYRSAERRKMVQQKLQAIGLDGLIRRFPHQLSGGERSRISLVRTLIAEPHAVMLDEPFSKLDKMNREHIRQTVFETIQHARIPALLVTHDVTDYPPVNNTVIEL